jgi:hypothetical protein
MKFYAQLNENNICIGMCQLSGAILDPRAIEVENYSYDYLWKKYDNGIWSTEKFEPQSTAPLTEFEQLKSENADLKTQLAATNADLASLMETVYGV